MPRGFLFPLLIIILYIAVPAQNGDECPRISVTGPAGVSMPSDTMSFVAEVNGARLASVRYVWEVTAGVIMGGQGTPILKTRYVDQFLFKASVRVLGLPDGCPNEASEVLHMSGPHPVPVHLASISSSHTFSSAVLELIAKEMAANATSQLYVWVYVGSTPLSLYSAIKSRILKQLITTKVDPTRFTLKISKEKQRGMIVWRVPVGSENPAP